MQSIQFPEDIERRIVQAAEYYWQTRSDQSEQQKVRGAADQGNRSSVTGGKQMDGFVELLAELLQECGVPQGAIYKNTALELPGYYRPNKKWDLLVIDKKELVLAIECKSQAGPSFGNNFNNRTEEAMGTAMDLWTAYREGVFGMQEAPWLGYFLVMEDSNTSDRPVKIRSPHFEVLPEFLNTSYKERYMIFCRKLVLERQYQAACFLTTGCGHDGVTCRFPEQNLSFAAFAQSMLSASLSHFMSWGKQK